MAMMSVRSVVALLCTMLVAANAATKSYLTMYKSAGGVDKYERFAEEVCQILDAASAQNFDQVKKIYEKDGKTSAGYSDSLRAFATSDFSTLRYNGLAQKYWGASGWMDSFMMSAIDGDGEFAGADRAARAQGVMKTAQSAIAVQLVLKELDTAADNMGEKNYDDKKGAPHALDEAWAVYTHRPTCGPYNLGDKYAAQFGTVKDCEYNTSTANIKVVNAFVAARAAAKKGDRAAFDTASDSIVQAILEVHIQAVLNYAKKMVGADGAKQKALQTEGYIFYRTIAPFIADKDKDADADIMANMKMSATVNATAYDEVKKAFEGVYPELKVDRNNIGAWQDSPSVTCGSASSAAASVAVKGLALFGGLLAAVAAAMW